MPGSQRRIPAGNPVYVSSADNGLADALSRGDRARFRRWLPNAAATPTPVSYRLHGVRVGSRGPLGLRATRRSLGGIFLLPFFSSQYLRNAKERAKLAIRIPV